jgi:CheY-like chemotaxis protein
MPILFVEDDPSQIERTRQQLEDLGYETQVCRNVKEVEDESVMGGVYDCIVLNMGMTCPPSIPKLGAGALTGGLHLLNEFRRQWPAVHIIILSGFDLTKITLGMTLYNVGHRDPNIKILPKPPKPTQLISLIENWP